MGYGLEFYFLRIGSRKIGWFFLSKIFDTLLSFQFGFPLEGGIWWAFEQLLISRAKVRKLVTSGIFGIGRVWDKYENF